MDPCSVIRVGLITDIQAADINDRGDRMYRDAPTKAKLARQDWEARQCVLAVNCGDIIDFRGCHGKKKKVKDSLHEVLTALNHPHFPIFHILGNHELYSCHKRLLAPGDLQLLTRRPAQDMNASAIEIDVGGDGYFGFRVGPGWLFIVVNAFEICHYGSSSRMIQEETQRAREHLEMMGKRTNHLSGDQNGAVGQEQLQWLRRRLRAAEHNQDQVIVFSHAPLHEFPPCKKCSCYCWNWHEVSDILDCYEPVVVCAIAGHHHCGSGFISLGGVHHRVLESALDWGEGQACHAILSLSGISASIQGVGNVTSWTDVCRKWRRLVVKSLENSS